MNLEPNNQQNDWLSETEALNDIEASQINGGNMSAIAARTESLYSSVLHQNLAFQAQTASVKVAKDQSGKVQG